MRKIQIKNLFMIITASMLFVSSVIAEEKTPHFATPFLATNPSPEDELRLNYIFENQPDGTSNEIEAELLYKLAEDIEFKFATPYQFINPDSDDSENNFANIELGIKAANYSFAEDNFLFSYGAILGLPTGDEDKAIGSDSIVSFEPFYSFGYIFDDIQLILSGQFEIPLNDEEEDEADNEFEFNGSLSTEMVDELQLFLELDGGLPLNGEERGVTVVNLSPGLQYELFDEFYAGVSVGFPLTDNKDFHTRVYSALYYEY